MRKRYDMLHPMRETNIFADLAVDLGWDSSIGDALYGHVFDDVFDGDIEGDHVLVVLDELAVVRVEEGSLLEEELLVETDCFDVLLQGCDEVQVYIYREDCTGCEVLLLYSNTLDCVSLLVEVLHASGLVLELIELRPLSLEYHPTSNRRQSLDLLVYVILLSTQLDELICIFILLFLGSAVIELR